MSRKAIIGPHELYLGDCREILPTLGKVDAVVTDPPYGIGASVDVCRHGHGRSDWDKEPVSDDVLAMIMGASDEQIIWGGNYFNLPPSRGFLVWDKCQPFDFTLAMAEVAWLSRDQNAKIFRSSPQAIGKEHPTQKPLDLMKLCLTLLDDAGHTILDPFMGSGTTGVACQKLGRKFIGIEIDERYFDIACRRIEEAMKQPDLFIEEPRSKPEQLDMIA